MSNSVRKRSLNASFGFSLVRPCAIFGSDIINPTSEISSRLYGSRAAAFSLVRLLSVVEEFFVKASKIKSEEIQYEFRQVSPFDILFRGRFEI